MALQTTLFDHSEIIADFSLLYKEVVHALWWNQPFASLMLHGKIETRTRPTKVRGKVLICTCRKPYLLWQVMQIAKEKQYNRIIKILGKIWDILPLGKAIAIADLIDCRPMQSDDADKCFVEYNPHLYCWVFDNVQQIEPFFLQEKQGWGILDEETKKKIKPIVLQPLTGAIAPVVK